METFTTQQRAYAGKFALAAGSKLWANNTTRPRLYDTPEAAKKAAASIKTSWPLRPVKLV